MTKKMAKPKTVVKRSASALTCSINGAVFHAEGDAAEVSAKFTKWLDDVFKPIRTVREAAEKTFKS